MFIWLPKFRIWRLKIFYQNIPNRNINSFLPFISFESWKNNDSVWPDYEVYVKMIWSSYMKPLRLRSFYLTWQLHLNIWKWEISQSKMRINLFLIKMNLCYVIFFLNTVLFERFNYLDCKSGPNVNYVGFADYMLVQGLDYCKHFDSFL